MASRVNPLNQLRQCFFRQLKVRQASIFSHGMWIGIRSCSAVAATNTANSEIVLACKRNRKSKKSYCIFKWSDFVPWTLETTRLLTSAEYKDVQDSALKVWRVRIQGFFWWRGTNLNSYCQYETIINFLPVESYQLLDCMLHSTSLYSYRNHTKPIAESSPLSSTTSVSFLANNKSMPLKCPHSLPPLSRQGWPTSSTYSKAASRTLGHSLTSQALVHPSLLRYCSCTKTARSKLIMMYRTLTLRFSPKFQEVQLHEVWLCVDVCWCKLALIRFTTCLES